MKRIITRMGILVLLLPACEAGMGPGQGPGSTTLADDAGTVVGDSHQPLQNGPEPCDGFDNNQDGQIDEGCSCTLGQSQACFPGAPGAAGVGICKQGTMTCEGSGEFGSWGPCKGSVGPTVEVCGNSVDEDCDGKDLPCAEDATPPVVADGGPLVPADSGPPAQCAAGQSQPCYPGPAGTEGVGACKSGAKTCLQDGTWGACVGAAVPSPEVCGNGVDEDCDGQDPVCPPKKVSFSSGLFGGDCIFVTCPPSDPYPVGCQVIFSIASNEPRGCVASTPTGSTVYFQAGNECTKGFVTGQLLCAKQPGNPLNVLSCPMIGKTQLFYVTSPSMCPK